MRAIVMSAGLGERMRPLTEHTPKPLLHAGGKPLIAWHLERLATIGVLDVVINTSWLADRFEPALGDGSHWGLRLHYLYEGARPLETGGGLLHALPLLDDGTPFLAVNGDIWTDVDFAALPSEPTGDAHLVLVDNPGHNTNGDFGLRADGSVVSEVEPGAQRLTFAGIGVYRASLFDGWHDIACNEPNVDATPPRFRLAPLLRHAMRAGRVTGQHHGSAWTDVGTPLRLAELDARLSNDGSIGVHTA